MKLLIVDDSNIIRRTITRYVEKAPFSEVFTAENGLAALEIFRAQRPEFVTLDITMPGIDGLTCLEEMLQHDANVRVLIISALGDRTTAIEALKRGAQAFLCKPFTAEELNEAISDLLSDV